MTEVVGDVVMPLELVLPVDADPTNLSGAGLIFLSGSKVWFHTGTGFEIVTSA